MKILVLNLNQAGIQKFRVTDPHIALSKFDGVDIQFGDDKFDTNSDVDCDAVFVHSSVATNPIMTAKVLKFAKNKKLIVDIDDYWNVPPHNYMHNLFKKQDFKKKIINLLKSADLITTTTKYLRDEIVLFNKNVVIIPNSIDPSEQQFIHVSQPSNRFRFGMATGSSHIEDIKVIRSTLGKLMNKNKDGVQFVLAGFDIKIKGIDGKIRMSYKDTIWKKYEEILTGDFKDISNEYTAFLKAAIPNKQYEKVDDEIYKRIWTKPIQQYGTSYNEMDTVVAPLRVDKFNSMKSELKIVEAGFHRLPIVCTNIGMYADVIKHGENGFLVDENKAHKDFVKYVNLLTNNVDMRIEMGENLYKTVNDRFNLHKNAGLRREHYLKLMQ